MVTTNALGDIEISTNSFVELSCGLNVLDEQGRWTEAGEAIEPLPQGGALARQAAHQVYFPANLFAGAIEFTPAGAPGPALRSRPLGLAYSDGQKSVFIAELQDGSVGQLLPSGNQVIYTNICSDYRLDLLVSYRKSGYESDLVIREQLPDPGRFGFEDAATVRVQWLTEFFDPVQPRKRVQVLANGLADQWLEFDTDFRMIQGRAFWIGNGPQIDFPVAKDWDLYEGNRTVLVEEIPFDVIAPSLRNLPLHASTLGPASPRGKVLRRLAEGRQLPPKRLAQRGDGKLLVARADYREEPGLILDFTVLASSLTNFTFAGDSTFYISGPVSLSGTTVCEGGAVLKFTNHPSACLSVNGSWVNQAGPFRMAVLTSKDDNSCGDNITGSTGLPSNDNGGTYLSFASGPADGCRYLRLAFAGTGISAQNLSGGVWHCQFLNCTNAIQCGSGTVALHNVLFSSCGTGVVTTATVSGEHVTADQLNRFAGSSVTGGTLTNSILTAVTTLGNVGLNNSAQLPGGSGVYQTAGAGSFYLAESSTNRNIGSGAINPTLLDELRKKTTYPPLILTNLTVSPSTNWSPSAQRDSDQIDRGYHYDPIDVLCSQIAFGTLTLTNGVSVGVFGATGFNMSNGGTLISEGRADAMNRLLTYQAVQEQPVRLLNTTPGSLFTLGYGAASKTIQLRFTDLPMIGRRLSFMGDSSAYLNITARFQDCWLRGLSLAVISSPNSASSPSAVTLTNNLIERSTVSLYNGYFSSKGTAYQNPLNASLYNNALWQSTLALNYYDLQATYQPTWPVQDNLFDSATISFNGDGNYQTPVKRWNNGFYNTSTNQIGGATNLVLTSLAYATGPLSRWYIGSSSPPLTDAGGRAANLAGLYHFTIGTNLVNNAQIKETNSIVDIGFHLVAVGADGLPQNFDGDSWADYLEDRNGDGIANGSETNWQQYNSPNGLTGGNGLQVFTPLK